MTSGFPSTNFHVTAADAKGGIVERKLRRAGLQSRRRRLSPAELRHHVFQQRERRERIQAPSPTRRVLGSVDIYASASQMAAMRIIAA